MTSAAQITPLKNAVSVITTCYGRNAHLYNLLASLACGTATPAEVIIVNDDADPERLAQFSLNIVQLPTSEMDEHQGLAKKTGFDIGRNRNIGADKAEHEALIFLDVDCIVAPDFIEQLSTRLQAKPEALLMGQPKYLTRPLNADECQTLYEGKLTQDALDALSVFNPYRHNLTEPDSPLMQTQDYGAFWSLCFAITRTQFARLGGFDTDYVGYGAEDTDFAFMARDLDIEFYLTSDVIYHQQHSVYRPPLNHLSSIVINANRFYDKWQHWPMASWLFEFAQMQLLDWQAEQTDPITLIRQPTDAQISAAHCPDAPFV